MKHIVPHRNYQFRACTVMLFLFVLSSCGQSNSPNATIRINGNTNNVVTISSTPTTDAGQSSAAPYTLSESTTTDGLQIVVNGIYCSMIADVGKYPPFPGHPPYPENLVVTTDKLIYDVGGAQKIQDYLQLIGEHSGEMDQWVPPLPPKGLQWLSGGKSCTGDVQITNTSGNNIEIDRLGFLMTSTPQPNTKSYRMVDYISRCYSGCGSVSPCAHQAVIALNNGNVGTLFDNQVTGVEECNNPIILKPYDTGEVEIDLQNAQKYDTTYTGDLTLSVTTSTEKKLIRLPALAFTLNFVNNLQKVPVYTFKGNAFQLE